MPLREMVTTSNDNIFRCVGDKPAPIWEGLLSSNKNPMTETACLMLWDSTLKGIAPPDFCKQLGGGYCNQSLLAWFCSPKNEKRHEKLGQLMRENPTLLDFILLALEYTVLQQKPNPLYVDFPSLINLRTTLSGNSLMNLIIDLLIQRNVLEQPQTEAQKKLTLKLVKYHNVVCTTACQLMHSSNKNTWFKFEAPARVEQQRRVLLENNRQGIEIWQKIWKKIANPNANMATVLNECLKITSPDKDLSISKQSFYGTMMEIESLLKTVDIFGVTAGLLRELRDRFMPSQRALSTLQDYPLEDWNLGISEVYSDYDIAEGALTNDIDKMKSDNRFVKDLWNEKVIQGNLIPPDSFSSQQNLFQTMDNILATLADQVEDPDDVAAIRQSLATINNAEKRKKFLGYAFEQLKGLNIDITTQAGAIVRQLIGWVDTERLNCNEDFDESSSEDLSESSSESLAFNM